MAFVFENLKVWQISFKLANEINAVSRQFPVFEKFSLATQIIRASDSVALNIAEGSQGQTKLFLSIAIRSAIEVVSCIMFAYERKYINEDQYKYYYEEYELLIKMITNLKKSIQ